MNKQFKRLLSAALSLAMVAGGVILPMAASAEESETELKSWKFDFGAESATAEAGYTLVTPDVNYTLNTSGDDQYGFIGTNENDYKLGERLDGFDQQQGQVIELAAGGSEATDGIGVVGAGGDDVTDDDGNTYGADLYGNKADKYYPVRFALKVPDDTYYKIKATVTTLDPEKDATASLYTERKHPLYTEKTITAGEKVETEFTIRVTPIYYQKSDPNGSIADGMVNVCVLGENTALASLEITQLETATTLWVLGDSTVTDGPGQLPFTVFPNYTGVGTGLTKYLPSNIAMVNEGEGGLNAADNYHFNMVSSRIKEGDYLYVEYGHNHKNATGQSYTSEYWLNNYVSSLKKYYEACKNAEGGAATLIIVGPIDRHQSSQYDSETNTWSSTLSSFSALGKQFVDVLMYGGETEADKFLAKWAEIATAAEASSSTDALKSEADKIVTEAVMAGTVNVSNVAFVDLNQPSLDWYATVTESGTVNDTPYTNNANLLDYYFQTPKSGSTDATHPNDAGAENLAYLFYTTADTAAYPALEPLMANFADGAVHEEPTPVSDEIINMGWAGDSDAWPMYNPPVAFEYPIVIKDVALDENNQFTSLTAYVQATFSNYASGVLEILDGDGNVVNTYVTTNHIDNTTGKGTNVLAFGSVDEEGNPQNDSNIYLAEGQTYRAYMWSCSTSEEELIPEDEGGEQLSSIYTPTEIEAYILPGENGGVEDFNYYGQTDLTGAGKYVYGGSAGKDLTLGTDSSGVTYTRVMSDGAKDGNANQGSFYVMRPLDNLTDEDGNAVGTGSSGMYMIDVDIMYSSGGGLNFAFCESTTPTKSPFISNQFTAFGIGSGGVVTVSGQEVGTISGTTWTNVKYILDMNSGTAEVSVAGGTPVTVDVPDYQTFGTPSISTLKHFVLEGQKVAFDVKLSNMTVAKLKDSGAQSTLDLSIYEPEQPDTYNVTVTADKAYSGDNSAALITAEYTNDGALAAVDTSDVELIEGKQTFEIELNEGAKLMLWDGLDTMKPFDLTVEKKEVEPVVMGAVYIDEENTLEKTVAQGSTVKAYAVPEEGYVFVKWIDGDGDSFSTDAELDLRLYKDLSLKAEFAKQKGVEDVTSFKIAADRVKVRTGTEQTVTVTESDVFDDANNPVYYDPDADITWTSSDESVTVDKGVVTIPASYDAGGNVKNTVTITAEINGIKRTVSLILYTVDEFEDFSNVASVSNWITDSSTSIVSEILDTASDTSSFAGMTAEGNGKVIVLGNGGSGENSSLSYEKDLGLSEKTTLKYGFDIEPYQIRTDGNSASVTLQFVGEKAATDDEGNATTEEVTALDITVDTAGNASKFDGTTIEGFVKGTVVSVDLEFNFTEKTMKYTLTNSDGKVLASGTKSDIEAEKLTKMKYSGNWQYGKFALDNVYAAYETAE